MKRKTKWTLGILLSLVLLVGLMLGTSATAYADGNVAKIGDAEYATLQAAIDACPTDGTATTITMIADYTGDEIKNPAVRTGTGTVVTGQNITLDLAGHKIQTKLTTNGSTYYYAHVLYVNGGSLTLTDSSQDKTGAVVNTNSGSYPCTRVVYVTNDANFTMESGRITATSGEGMRIDNATVKLNGGVVEATTASGGTAVGWDNEVAGIEVRGNSTVTIDGATITSAGQNAIYSDQASNKITIKSGVLSGNTGYGAIGGSQAQKTITITGGYFNTDPTNFLDVTVYQAIIQDSGSAYDGYYKVEPVAAAEPVTVTTLQQLMEATESATLLNPKDITLGADIVVDTTVKLRATSKLNIPSEYKLSVVSGGMFQNEGRTTNLGELSVSGGGFFSNLLAVEGEGQFSGYPDTFGTYQITYPMDLEWMSWLNREVYTVTDAILTTDITMPNVYFDPIPGFYGTFDGNGHSIHNLKLHSTSQPLGLFNTLGISLNDEHTFVQDLTIEEELSTVSARCGGLAAYTTGNVHITGVKMQGSMEASGATYYFAPFVGYAYNNGHHLYIADSETSMTVTADRGANIGPIIGSAGNGQSFTIGIYNFKNTGAISAKGANNSIGYVLGYGYGKSTTEPITIDVINYENTGSITNNYGTWQALGTGANYLCCNSGNTVFKTTYISTQNTAYYNQFKDIYSTDTPPVALIERTGEETQYFDSLKDAVEVAQSGDTITMVQNVDLGTDTKTLLTVPETANLTLDLNGFVISGSTNGVRMINNYGKLVIKDSSTAKTGEIKNISTGTNDCTRTLGNGTDTNHTASMTIESGKISSTVGQVIINQANLKLEKDAVLVTTATYSGNYSNGAVVLDNCGPGVAEIDGATLTTDNGMLMYVSSGSDVSIKGGTFTANANRGLGGSDSTVKVTGGTFNIDPSAIVVQGYYVEENSGLYTVKKMEEPAVVTVTSEEELSQVLADSSAGKPVQITVSGNISVQGNLKLFKGSSITIPQGNSLRIEDGGVLAVEGVIDNNGKLTIAENGFLANPLSVVGDGQYIYKGYDEASPVYSISSPMGLQWLTVINSGDTIDDLTVELTKDVTFPDGVVFQQIPYFRGKFDGKNHTISGLVIKQVSNYTGVFTGMESATVKNVTLDEIVTANSGNVGGVVGYIYDETHFQNVKVKGSISVAGSSYGTAGFVGVVSGQDADKSITFENCESSMTISAPNASIVGGFYGTASSNETPIDVMDCTYSGNMTSGGYCATVGGYMSNNLTGKTTVYGHTIKGTVTGNSTLGKFIDDVMVLGADGHGEIKNQGVASVGNTSYSDISDAVNAALEQKKPLSLNTNMDTTVDVELTNEDDVFMIQQNGFTAQFNVTYGGTDQTKTIRTRVDTNITVKYVGPSEGTAEGDTEFKKDDQSSSISGLDETAVVEGQLKDLAEEDDTSTEPDQVKDVTVTLDAKAVEDIGTVEQNAIAIAVTDKVSEDSVTDFLELTVIKRVTVFNADGTKDTEKSTETIETNLNQVLDISVKYDMTGKHNLMVSRYHNGAVTFFTKLNEKPSTPVDGTFYVEGTEEQTIIHLYTSKFSTYAFTTFGASEYSAVTKAPTAKTLVYTGSAQELVTPGEATGGTMRYALGTDATTVPTEGWDETIPVATEIGTYYVWYKVKGDVTHSDTEPAGPVTVKLGKKPLTITAAGASKTFDGTALTKNSYFTTGLMDGDRITSIKITGSITSAGSAPNTASDAVITDSAGEDVTGKYDITYRKGTLVVVKKSVSVKADDKTKVYDNDPATDPELTATVTGEVKGYPVNYTLSREAGEAVGSYKITVTPGNNPNYVLRVTGAELTITEGTAPVYGEPDFTLPGAIRTIEDNAFEGGAMRIVYIPDPCTAIGAGAFKDCANLTQIRLPKNCELDDTIFDGCGKVYVFAPAGGTTESWCQGKDNIVFVGMDN